jgi:hypothetical protein
MDHLPMKAVALFIASFPAIFCQSLPSPGPGMPVTGSGGGGGGGAITLVANVLGPPGTSTTAISPAIDINTGGPANGLYVWATGAIISGGTTFVTDNQGNTYAPTVFFSGSTNAQLWYADNGTGSLNTSSSLTVTMTVCPGCSWGVVAVRGMKTAGSYDGAGKNVGVWAAPGTTVQAGPINPGSGKHLIFYLLSSGSTAGNFSGIDSGFTILQQQAYNSGINYQGGLGYLIQPNGASAAPTATFSASSSGLIGLLCSFGGL